MIEKWLRNEIDKKICNSNRIVILDQTSRWKFLIDAACTDFCLYSTKDYSSKWQQKQDQESQKGYLVNLIKNTSKKIAIIVGDGVRYEVADSVASRVASDISVDKKFMYAGLPSETEHNMSALYTTAGEIIAEKKEREKKLSDETGKDITYMQLDEVNGTTDGEILVLTYKDIDDAGEKMQQSMLRLVDEFEDILVEKIQLLLHLGYKEVHLVTDHGFVLTGILDESDKIPTDDISGSKKVSERYIRSVDEQSGSKYISIEEHYENYNYVNFAKSSRPFVSTGKYGYSHGGFTPQEVVIPNFVFTYNKQNQMDVDITSYIKNKGFDDKYYKDLVVEYLKQYKSAKKKDIRNLLWGKLPEALSDTQKENKIRNLLTSMKKAGIIDTDSDNQQKSNWILK